MKITIKKNGYTTRSHDAAAETFDTTSCSECGFPAFTAMCVTTSFASCFGRAPSIAGPAAQTPNQASGSDDRRSSEAAEAPNRPPTYRVAFEWP